MPRSVGVSRWFLHSFAALVVLSLASGCDRSSPSIKSDSTKADLPSDDELRAKLDAVLDHTQNNRRLQSDVNAAWQVMHGVLAFGSEFHILHDGQLVNAAEWLLNGGTMTGWTVRKGDQGLKVELEAGTKTGQGHPDQWLSKFTWCDLPSDYPVTVAGEKYTLGDMIKQAMWDVYQGKECSWTLIVLAKYVRLDTEWKAKDGETWTQEKVLAMEAAQDINASPCGGTHRLAGMTIALNRYREANPGQALTGGWLAADEKIQWAIQKAQEFQQPSGALSVNYFQRAADSPDATAHIGSTGHTLEFLTLAMSDEQLREPWMVRAVERLCKLFEQTKEVDLECGALYHAAHGLVLYRERRFGKRPPAAESSSPALTESPEVTADSQGEAPASESEPLVEESEAVVREGEPAQQTAEP